MRVMRELAKRGWAAVKNIMSHSPFQAQSKPFVVAFENVGNMLGCVGMTPTLSAKNWPMSNVANAVTEFMVESRVG